MALHSSSVIHDGAEVPDDAEVGPLTIIHSNVQLGAGSKVSSHCVLGEPSPLANGEPLVIGRNATIRSHTVLYEGSTFGADLETGHHVTLREGLLVGENLRVGSYSDLQGDAVIGRYVRLHSGVFIAKGTTLGDFVWVFPHSVLTNDPHPPSEGPIAGPTIEEYAVIGAGSLLLPGVTVGSRSLVAASSVVTRDVESDTFVRGAPARAVSPTSDIGLRDGSGRPAYPWTAHFTRGYPDEITTVWDSQ